MALLPLSEYWRGQRKTLRQFLWGVSSEGSVGPALVQALRQPLTHHVQQYVHLLLSLGDTIEDVSGRALLTRLGGDRAVAKEDNNLSLRGSHVCTRNQLYFIQKINNLKAVS